jgi:hypothetical protein
MLHAVLGRHVWTGIFMQQLREAVRFSPFKFGLLRDSAAAGCQQLSPYVRENWL